MAQEVMNGDRVTFQETVNGFLSFSAKEQVRLNQHAELKAYLDGIDQGLYEFICVEILQVLPNNPTPLFDLFSPGSFGIDAHGEAVILAPMKRKRVLNFAMTATGVDLHSPGGRKFRAFLTSQLPYGDNILQIPTTAESAISAAAHAYGHYQIRRKRLSTTIPLPSSQSERKALLNPISPELVIAVQTLKSLPAETSTISWMNFDHAGLDIPQLAGESMINYAYRAAGIMLNRALIITMQQVAQASSLEAGTAILSQVSEYIVAQAIAINTPTAIREQILGVGLGILGKTPDIPKDKNIVIAAALDGIDIKSILMSRSGQLDVSVEKRLAERYFEPILKMLYRYELANNALFGQNQDQRLKNLSSIDITTLAHQIRAKWPPGEITRRLPDRETITQLFEQYKNRIVNQPEIEKNRLTGLLTEMLKLDGPGFFAELLFRVTRKRSVLLSAKSVKEISKGLNSWIRTVPEILKIDALTQVMDILLANNSVGSKLVMDILTQLHELKDVMDAYRKTGDSDMDGQELIHAASTSMTAEPGKAWVAAAPNSKTITTLASADPKAPGPKEDKPRATMAHGLAERFKLAFMQDPVLCLTKDGKLDAKDLAKNLPFAVTTETTTPEEKEIKALINSRMADAIEQVITYLAKTDQSEKQIILTMLMAMLVDPTLGTTHAVLRKHKIIVDVDWRQKIEDKILSYIMAELRAGLTNETKHKEMIDLLIIFGPSMGAGTKNRLLQLYVVGVNFDLPNLADEGRWEELVMALGFSLPEVHLRQISKSKQRGNQVTLNLAAGHSANLISGYSTKKFGYHDGVATQLIRVYNQTAGTTELIQKHKSQNGNHNIDKADAPVEFSNDQIKALRKTIIAQCLSLFGPLGIDQSQTAHQKNELLIVIRKTLIEELTAIVNYQTANLREKLNVIEISSETAKKELAETTQELEKILHGENNDGLLAQIKAAATQAVETALASPVAKQLGLTTIGDAERDARIEEIAKPLRDLLEESQLLKAGMRPPMIMGGSMPEFDPAKLIEAATNIIETAEHESLAPSIVDKRQRAKVLQAAGSFNLKTWLSAHGDNNQDETLPSTVLQLAEALQTQVSPYLKLNTLKIDVAKAFILMARQRRAFIALERAEENAREIENALDLLADGIDNITGQSLTEEVNNAMRQIEPTFAPIKLPRKSSRKKK